MEPPKYGPVRRRPLAAGSAMAPPVPQPRPAGTRSDLGFPESHSRLRATARSEGACGFPSCHLNRNHGSGGRRTSNKGSGLRPRSLTAGGCKPVTVGAVQPGLLLLQDRGHGAGSSVRKRCSLWARRSHACPCCSGSCEPKFAQEP